MSAFETLQTRHQELLKMEHEKAEVLTEAQKFIDDARQAGGTIGPPQEREQLRANMRYWAGYVYDHTTPNFYPTTDLRPYSGPALSAMNWAPWIIAGGILLAAISIALGAGGLATVQLLNPTSTPVAGLIGSPTLAAGIATTTMPTATALPTLALIVTATPITELSPTAPPTQDVTGIVAQLTSPADGQEISPRVKLAGTFSNLQPGWSIHVLLQPLSQAGRYYPLEQFVTVQAGSPSGDWALDAAFGEGAELEKAEQYNISLVVALDDKTRAELARAPRSGFDALPSGVIPFPQVTTVRRGAYEAINETRVVYSLLIHEQSTIELFTARPDGSDGRQLTRTANSYELQPGVSPSGKQIVFVGSEQDATGVTVSSLWLMDSDGQNRTLLATQPGVIYERPVWSPDGRYFAYDANIPDDTGDTSNNLFIYDTTTGESTRLTQGPPHKRFPSWTREGDALIFSQVSDN